MRLIVLRTGNAAPEVAAQRGEFFSWIRREVGDAWTGEWHEHDVRTDHPLPKAGEASAFIITGSSSSVTERAPWMLRTEALIRDIADARTPLFGICFGHQIVAQALGGAVAKNPRGREMGTVEVRVHHHDPRDPILEHVGERFHANHTHVDSVIQLPPNARRLASTDLEENSAYSIGSHIKCVQFHPEFDGEVMRGYISARAHLVDAEGGDSKGLLSRAIDAPGGASLLRNFVRHVVARPLVTL